MAKRAATRGRHAKRARKARRHATARTTTRGPGRPVTAAKQAPSRHAAQAAVFPDARNPGRRALAGAGKRFLNQAGQPGGKKEQP